MPDDTVHHEKPRGFNVRLGVWLVLTIGLLVYLAFGNVAVVSYTYNAFLRRTFKEEGRETVMDIWSYQVSHLPSASMQLVVDTAFVASLVIMVVGVIYGVWLLLVRSARESDTMSSYRARRLNSQ